MRRQILWSALAVAALTLLAGLIAGAAIRRQLVQNSEAELLRQAEATANLVQSGVREALPSQDTADRVPIARTLEIARSIGGHDYVEASIVSPGTSRPSLIDLPETPLLDSLGDDPPLDQITSTEVDGEPVLAYVRAVPIRPRGEAVVLIAIGRTEPLLATNILTRPLVFSLGIGAILAIILANWVASFLSRRLHRLEATSRTIAAGDFSARAPTEGSDDVAKLGVAFNEMAAQLEEAQRRERDFLMSVGHDLRTPLTTLRGYAEALEAGQVERADLARVAGVLHRQTDRLGRLIDDLTLLARLEAREFTLRPEPVELAAHLREMVDTHRVRAGQSQINLSSEIADVGTVTIDPDRFGQIVGNLLTNALRYTPEGGRVTIGLREASEGPRDEVVLTVADTGPGIDAEDLPHVFERLYVAQRYRPVRPEGSGLGLTIVNELSAALQGSVEVASGPGEGTVVTVRLPRTTTPETARDGVDGARR